MFILICSRCGVETTQSRGGIFTTFETLTFKMIVNMNITPFIKDKVLNCLCDDSIDFESLMNLNQDEFLKITELSFNELLAVLRQFERLGFVSNLNARRRSSSLYLCIHLDALDFKKRGGFIGQEELLKINIEKLLLEIESLEPSLQSKTEKITKIASNIKLALDLIMIGNTAS